MNRKTAYAALELPDNAPLDDVKRAYRRLAFALHPDLNPDKPDAAAQFQKVNEAYVLLGEMLSPKAAPSSARSGTGTRGDDAEATAKARSDAQKAYKKAQGRVNREEKRSGQSSQSARSGAAGRDLGKDEVLQDLLRDPFARRVFEDIYSQIRHDTAKSRVKPQSRTAPARAAAHSSSPLPGAVGAVGSAVGKAVDSMQNWVRRQIDDEQTVYLPGPSLVPGARLRLQVSHGFSDKPQTIEVTLPPEFQIGRPIRLKGMGRRLGTWKGDLYLRILPKKPA